MSQNCGDPTCPVHGTDPEAIALRQAVQEIKTNEEMMSLVRILASNALQAAVTAIDRYRGFSDPADILHVMQVLNGEADQDASVQGIITGFAVLMIRGHEPTKVLVTSLSEVKEPPYLSDRLTKTYMENHPRIHEQSLDKLLREIFGVRR